MSGSTNRLQHLESVRGLAALYVFLHHYVHCTTGLEAIQKFFVFGQTAVMVFLILSGFVNYYATLGTHATLSVRDFLVRRLRRIYPPFILVLALTWLINSLGHHDWSGIDARNLIGNLLMLQDKQHPHTWFSPYLGNSPLWTMSYEWWFYMLFIPVGYFFKAQPARRQYAAAAISVVGFVSYLLVPNQFSIIAAYFMMWWSGAEMAREYVATGKVTYRGQAFSIVILALQTALWGTLCLLAYRETGHFSQAIYPFVQLRHQSTILVLIVAAIAWHKLRFVGLRETIGIFRHISPISYVLYILHVPIILYSQHLQLTGSVWLDFLWVTPLVFGLSWLIEVPLQRKINQWIR